MKKYLFGMLLVLAFIVPMTPQAIAEPIARAKYCTITAPADGATISGTVLISISASKTPSVYIDGVYVGRFFSANWDTTGWTDGVHTVYATAHGLDDTITVTLANGGAPPNNAPVVTIGSPTADSTVSDTVTITVDVEDEDSLVPDIYIDGAYVTTALSYTWDTTAYADGSHTIYAEATDSGDLSDSDSITVTVENAVPPPPPPPPPADGDDWFSGTVAYGVDSWHYFDAGIGTINAELSWGNSYDIDMYLYRPSDYVNYVVRAYTTANPEFMTYNADECGMWAVMVRMYTSRSSETAYDLHVTYTPNTPDVTDPTCTITDPVNNDVVYKTKYIKVTATDDRNVDHVDYYIDGVKIGTDASAPFSYAWDTTAYADGVYTIDATAYDAAGNTGNAAQVTVTVDQSAAPAIDVQRYAVIVGISDYKAISDLSYCDEDATDWYDYFISIGYADENIWVFGDGHTSNYPKYDGYATEANVKAALNNMIALADNDDIINFVTSGHGSGDGNGESFLCMWDCSSGESGEDGSMYDHELAAIMGTAIAGQIHVFIDHCYSGGMGPELMALGNADAIYCSATCTEDGYGYDDSQHLNGMWTYWFLEAGLVGQFGSDPNTTMEDAFAWASANYPKQPPSGDAPMEFDGNSGNPFIL